jgi:stress-induced morphogen
MLLGVTQEKHIGVKDISHKNSREKQNTHFTVNTVSP